MALLARAAVAARALLWARSGGDGTSTFNAFRLLTTLARAEEQAIVDTENFGAGAEETASSNVTSTGAGPKLAPPPVACPGGATQAPLALALPSRPSVVANQQTLEISCLALVKH